jgi:hypothetical protein
MQHGEFFQAHPPLTFLVVPLMYIGQVFVGRLFRQLRGKLVHGGEHKHFHKSMNGMDEEELLMKEGHLYVLHKYEEEVTEAMNDVASLCVSFLTVQACRFNVSGVLPDNLGIEEEKWQHPMRCSVILACLAVFFAVASAVFVVIYSKAFSEIPKPGSFWSLVKRAVAVSKSASAMCMAWCLLYVAKWEVGRNLNMYVNPNMIIARVCMAVGISFFSFTIITLLDKLADMDCTGPMTDEAIIQIINAISILVGFSWEQAFDGAVEVLGARTPHPVVAEMVLAVFVAVVVIAPWRRYILMKVIHLQDEREAAAEDVHSHHYDLEDKAHSRPSSAGTLLQHCSNKKAMNY